MGSTKNKNVVPKALPNYDEEFFRSLTRNVVLVGNEVNLITPTKTDKKHSRKIDKEENSEVDNVTVRRNVFNKNNPYYAKCVAIKTEWEKWFKDNTIPYFGRGLGLVTTANYQQFAKENSEFARRYNKALKEFFANYESIIQGSFIFGKGSKRAIELASTLDQVKAKCGAKHSVAPFGDYIQSNGAKGRTAFSIVAQETNKVVSGAVKKVTDTIFSNVIKEFSRLCHGTGETKGGYLVARSEGLKNNLSGNSTAIYSNRIDGCRNSLDDLEKNNITQSPLVDQFVKDGRSLLADITTINKKKDTLQVTDNVTVLDKSIKKIDKLVDSVTQEKIQKLNDIDKAFG